MGTQNDQPDEMGNQGSGGGQGQSGDPGQTGDPDQMGGQGQAGGGTPTWDQTKTPSGGWDQGSTDEEKGDETRPKQPEGTTPLERDPRPINQAR